MEAEYVNDILYDEYCSEVDNYSCDYDEDFDPYIHNFKSGTWQESMELHGYVKSTSGALWEMFKSRLNKPEWNGVFLFRKTNGDINNMYKLIHETEKAILIQEYDDELDKLIPNKSFWVPRSLLHFKKSEPKSLVLYVPWFFNIKYIIDEHIK